MPTRLGDLRALKGKRPWAMLTCYDYATAKHFAAAGVECLLVGDSAANVVYGYESTTRVSLDELAFLAAAVVRGAGDALVVADLPFGTYEASDEQAVRSATEMVRRSGAHMVKIEGGVRIASRIVALKAAGLSVCAHVGFTPQSVDNLSGFKVQGRGDGARALREDVEAVVAAGADMVVLEMVPGVLAAEITRSCPVPTVGIGAGTGTDAQVLVWHDMAGASPSSHVPSFVKLFGEVGSELTSSARRYREAVESGAFPTESHTFS